MAAIMNKINGSQVAPWLRKEITDAIAALEKATVEGRYVAIKEADTALLGAAASLHILRGEEADGLWRAIGKARAAAATAMLPHQMGRLKKRFGNSRNGDHPKRERNGRSAKPGQILPPGILSPFAGTPPEDWQTDLERGRQRQVSGGVSRRGAPVPGTRKRSASSKKT